MYRIVVVIDIFLEQFSNFIKQLFLYLLNVVLFIFFHLIFRFFFRKR